MDWFSIVLTALLSSLLTLVIGAVVVRVWVMPELERHFDRKADEAAARIEQQMKQRIAQGFADVVDSLHGVIRDRATTVARTTADIVGDGVRRVIDRIGPGRGGPADER